MAGRGFDLRARGVGLGSLTWQSWMELEPTWGRYVAIVVVWALTLGAAALLVLAVVYAVV